MIASAIESQSTACSTATGTSTVSAGSSDTTGLIARQPPVAIDTETAAATNPTYVRNPTAALTTHILIKLLI